MFTKKNVAKHEDIIRKDIHDDWERACRKQGIDPETVPDPDWENLRAGYERKKEDRKTFVKGIIKGFVGGCVAGGAMLAVASYALTAFINSIPSNNTDEESEDESEED